MNLSEISKYDLPELIEASGIGSAGNDISAKVKEANQKICQSQTNTLMFMTIQIKKP